MHFLKSQIGGTAHASSNHKPLSLLPIVSTVALLLSTSQAQTTEVRVNQVGYTLKEPKRAYLMTTGSATGAMFRIMNSKGATAFGPAPVGKNLGKWGNFTVFALDFDSLSTSDVYKVAVSGAVSATSPNFKIDTGENVYRKALSNKLFFYQTERDDAGDYLKFVETHSYVVSLMLIGVRDFPDQLGAGSRTSNFTDEARFGLDWMQKMWHDNTKTLYYQVGIGGGNNTTISDHDFWRLPQVDDSQGGTDPQFRFIRNRPVFHQHRRRRRRQSQPQHRGTAGCRLSPSASRFSSTSIKTMPTPACAPPNMSSIWLTPTPKATCSRLAHLAFILKQNGVMIWNWAPPSFILPWLMETFLPDWPTPTPCSI